MGYIDVAVVFGIVGSVAVVVLANYFVYNSPMIETASELAGRLKRNVDVVEKKLKTSSGAQTAKLQKELDRLKAELLPAQQGLMGLSMRATLLAAVGQMFVYWLLRRLYNDVAIATLPFTPTWSYFRMIFQSGLTTAASVTEAQKAAGAVVHPSNAASYLPFMITAGMLLRPLASRLAGTVEGAKKLAGATGQAPSIMEMSETLGKQYSLGGKRD